MSRARLDEIGMGDPSFTVDLIDIMLVDGMERIEKIRASFTTGDCEEVGRTAHSLKGAALNVGALTLATLCAEIDDTVRKLRIAITDDQVDKVEEEFSLVKEELLNIKSELSA
ncbi:MAG: Hpt domain-containing protein [Calditrichaeota bacterium]|nr:Hpt domain-containing protein [Calditrichota bacterium]